MFTPERFSAFPLQSHPRRAAVTRILAAAFRSVHAGAAVKNYLRAHPLPDARRVCALGLGKAAPAMTAALADVTRLADSLVIAKYASRLDGMAGEVVAGNHPIPGDASLAAGRAALNFLARLHPDDLLVCLLSGGGSALMAAPTIPLPELQALTSALLASGATISQINTARRHLDLLKGGGVAERANGARVVSLILSDVVGDAIADIASGVAAPDPTTTEDARAVVGRVNNSTYKFRETLKPGRPIFRRVENHIIASNDTALRAAREQARREGFDSEIIASEMQGEARDVGEKMAGILKRARGERMRPFCLLAGGETTVTLRGDGKGGRNQELALGAVEALRGVENILLVAIASDGEDGVTDAAGAAVSGESARRAESLGLDAPACLSRNDAYSFFAGLGDLIRTGPSGTNVNDLVLLFGF